MKSAEVKLDPVSRSSARYPGWVTWSAPYLAFLMVILVVGTQTQGFLKPAVDFWVTTSSQFKALASGDANGYVALADYFLRKPPYDEKIGFLLSTWPPGFAIVVAAVIGLTGEATYFAKMFAVSALTLALVFTCAFRWFPVVRNPWLRWILFAGALALPEFRTWTLAQGYILSESSTLYILFFAWSAAFFAFEKRSTRTLLFAGIALGLASYFRAMLSIISDLMLISAILLVVANFIGSWMWDSRFKWSDFRSGANKSNLRAVILGGAIFLGGAWLIAIPWKIRNARAVGLYTMSAATDYEYDLHWTVPEKEPAFVHGASAACVSDPNLCEIIGDESELSIQPYRKPLVFMTLATHAKRWLRYKYDNFPWFWTGVGRRLEKQDRAVWATHLAEGVLYLVMGCASLFALIFSTRALAETTRVALLAYATLFVLAHGAIFLIAHYEVRYSLFLREFAVWSFLAIYSRPRSGRTRDLSALRSDL